MNKEKIKNELAREIDLILDAIQEDLLITDEEGVVVKVSPTFENVYGIKEEEALGMTVFEMEKQGYFKPSIVAIALKKRERVTMQQKNNQGRDILVTATPVFNENKVIKFVISFSRDITEMIRLQKNYATLEGKVQRYEQEIQHLRNSDTSENVICEDEKSRETIKNIKRIASYDSNIILLGESGVGKTMFAKELHRYSKRAKGPFVDMNCAAIPENLMESELFGYEKGAFTGASGKGKMGFFELAEGGTLFLDEISEMSLVLQAKFLKVIQDKIVTRVGGIKGKKVDFRLVVASNKDIKKCVENGTFREDLYYRLNVLSITIPSIAERPKDIVPMCKFFLEKFNKKYNQNKSLGDKAFRQLLNYSWPGNVREMENIIERSAMMSGSDCIEEIIFESGDANAPGESNEYLRHFAGVDLNNEIQKLEKNIITKAYDQLGN